MNILYSVNIWGRFSLKQNHPNCPFSVSLYVSGYFLICSKLMSLDSIPCYYLFQSQVTHLLNILMILDVSSTSFHSQTFSCFFTPSISISCLNFQKKNLVISFENSDVYTYAISTLCILLNFLKIIAYLINKSMLFIKSLINIFSLKSIYILFYFKLKIHI